MKSGIYKIENLITKEVYIGKSNDLRLRKKTHWRDLKNNNHFNSRLQNAWNKYGESNFKFEVMENIQEEFLIIREQHYLNEIFIKKTINAYNISNTAENVLEPIIISKHMIKNNPMKKEENKQIGKDNHMYRISENHHNAKLNWDKINKIRQERKENDTSYQKLADKYNVYLSTIAKIIRNELWQDDNYIVPEIKSGKSVSIQTKKKLSKLNAGENHPVSKLTWNIVNNIRSEYLTKNITQRELARKHNINCGTICRIINNQIWKRRKGCSHK